MQRVYAGGNPTIPTIVNPTGHLARMHLFFQEGNVQ